VSLAVVCVLFLSCSSFSAHTDTPDQVDFLLSFSLFHFPHTRLQTARNRELAEVAFPNGTAPKYGPAILKPEFCGKWKVSLRMLAFCLSFLHVVLDVRYSRPSCTSGAGILPIKFLFSQNQSSYSTC
jgi:hypothetical protein